MRDRRVPDRQKGRHGGLGPLRVLAAWLPMAALWTLITVSAQQETGLANAARFGFVSIGVAAALGVAVWRLTAAVPWPDRVGLGFYLVHAGIGALYAISWVTIGSSTVAALAGMSPFAWHLDGFMTFWRFLMGLLLYGLTAGICYAMRIREQLRLQERATLAARTLAAEARLESLRAQLNPHFLFNSLHSVSELMHDDVAAAERAIEDLADLLRYSLDSETGEVVTLAEEWDFVEGYLSLERIRLGDRLRVDTHLANDALRMRLPSFTLQLLVENAIRHAIAPRPDGGRIEVRAERAEGWLRIEVHDDGPGFTLPDARAGDGRGLELLEKRLEAIYGNRGRLEVDEAPDRGARVRVHVPVAEGATERAPRSTPSPAQEVLRPEPSR